MQTSPSPKPESDGVLPQGFKTLLGALLLTISIGFMSLWGLFS